MSKRQLDTRSRAPQSLGSGSELGIIMRTETDQGKQAQSARVGVLHGHERGLDAAGNMMAGETGRLDFNEVYNRGQGEGNQGHL